MLLNSKFTIFLFCLLIYFLILLFSQLNHSLRHPNLVYQYITNGPTSLLLPYGVPIILWVVLLVSFFILITKYRFNFYLNRGSNKLIFCFVGLISLIFFHSIICLHMIKNKNDELHLDFKEGVQNEHGWIGWDLYKREDYYHQTLERVEKNKQKQFSQIQVCLETLDGGLYSLKRWLDNNVFVIDFLYLAYRSLGVLALLSISLICILLLKWKNICLFSSLFILIWTISLSFFIITEITQSLQTLNTHPVCLQAPHSGKVNIIIDKRAQDKIIYQHNFSTHEDPLHVYTSICSKTTHFYNTSVQIIIAELISNVISVVWIGCLIVQITILASFIPQLLSFFDKIMGKNEKFHEIYHTKSIYYQLPLTELD